MKDNAKIKKIKLSKSIVGDTEKRALAEVIDNAYLGMGSYVQQFEKELGTYLGRNPVLCVNSGSAALHLALMGIGLVPGDEVLVQSLTFVACFQAISAVGAKPIACEVIPQTCTIDLEDAEKRITERTKAIMPVHYAGRTGNLEEIYRFARRYGLRVVEDAAHAFGTVYEGKRVGSFGDVVCFSFDGIKNITSGEGGAVVTKDAKVAQCVMDARLLGVHKDTEKRYEGKRSWEFDVFRQGYRYHMSNLFAAIGVAQLARLEKEFKPCRQTLAQRYHRQLSPLEEIILFPNDYDEVVPHIFPIKVIHGKRDSLRKYLLDSGIECGVHYHPNHLLKFYSKQKLRLPVTEKIYSQLLSLPLHPELAVKDLKYITDKIKYFFARK
jgi:dTDP-4-amino-4,6-dideoxygalactose transaminase